LTPLGHIRQVFANNKNCFFPACLALEKELDQSRPASAQSEALDDIYDKIDASKLPYTCNKTRRGISNAIASVQTTDKTFVEEYEFYELYAGMHATARVSSNSYLVCPTTCVSLLSL
jgi:hypothetical protein